MESVGGAVGGGARRDRGRDEYRGAKRTRAFPGGRGSLPSDPMHLRPGPNKGQDGNAVYLSPNDPFAVDWQPKGEASVDVAAPSDLVRRSDVEAAPGRGDDAVAAHLRQRIAHLEGELSQAEKLEAAAQRYADSLDERSAAERERHASELDGLRTQLEHKERELRTLALEMGKVQGRLEAAEAKLLAGGATANAEHSSNEPAAQPGSRATSGAGTVASERDTARASAASTPTAGDTAPNPLAWTQTTMGMFLVGVITVGVVALLLLAMTS